MSVVVPRHIRERRTRGAAGYRSCMAFARPPSARVRSGHIFVHQTQATPAEQVSAFPVVMTKSDAGHERRQGPPRAGSKNSFELRPNLPEAPTQQGGNVGFNALFGRGTDFRSACARTRKADREQRCQTAIFARRVVAVHRDGSSQVAWKRTRCDSAIGG